jgi:subtilisin family serine protease
LLCTPRSLLRAAAAGAVTTVVAALGAVSFAGPAAAEPPAPPPTSDTGRWIVQLAGPSLAALQAPAGTVDVTTGSARAYLDQLAEQQAEVAGRIGEELGRTVTIGHSYRNVLNAIAIEADPAEAAVLTGVAGVVSVEPDRELELTTDVSNDLIGSAAAWDGGTGSGLATRGEGVVVGILDSGINPQHPAFAATDGEGYTHTNPYDGYLGVCDPAHEDHDPICNDKLVGAYSFVGASAQDVNGHGSHTASTAAGNVHDVTLTYGGDESTRTVQGVAPRANLVAYRVCLTSSCPTSAILAGINQAIADGVDVLNYSISGGDSPWNNSISRAFLEAFGAGIFVSTSAGNSGPTAGSVAHTAPWNASVAATTTDRTWANDLSVLGPDPVPPELAVVPASPSFGPGNESPIEAELVYSGEVGSESGCGSFDDGAFAGTIALIPTGSCAFATKVDRAADAGAVAVVLFERRPGPAVFMSGMEGTAVPSFSVDQATGEALEALVTGVTEPVTIELGATTELVRDPAAADSVAWFSSRGPSNYDLLAPTFAAPGVNILAAYRAVDGDPLQYNIIRGTSMASPHVAGGGALLAALHPDWSPAQIRAALAGTADPVGVTDEEGEFADPLQTGAGRIDLAAAGRVGLVMDESYGDMLAANPSTGGDPRTLNVPYLVNQECSQVCSFTREVTSAADAAATYTATVAAPAGATGTVDPVEFTLAPGASQELTITLDVSGSSGGQWVFADLQLSTGDNHAGGTAIAGVHYPVAVIPVAPAISVDPTEIGVELKPERSARRGVSLGNSGNGPLEWELAGGSGCDLPADLPWLSSEEVAGTVGPGDSTQLRLTLDTAGQAPGVLAATLCVASNDPAVPLVTVAVTLTVLDLPNLVLAPEELAMSQPAGTITGTPLTITNTGTSALDWSIGEAPVEAAAAGPALAALDPGRKALLRDGVLLVPDTSADRVVALDPETGDVVDPEFIIYPEDDLGTTTHIILNAAQDGLLVSSQSHDVVYSFGLDGEFQGVFAPIGGRDTSIMDNIRGMAISPWGTLLVTSAGDENVVEFSEDGEFLGEFITAESGGIDGPWYVLFREDDVLVSASSGNIYQYDHTGAPLSVWEDEINFPQQLYRQADGNILAAAFSSPSGVWELDPDGELIGRYTGIQRNRGVYPLPSGNILTSNSGGVYEIDRGTVQVGTKYDGGARMISEIARDQPCEEPADVPWLSVSETAGTTAAGASSEVTVLVDSTGLAPGLHEAHVCVSSNDPDADLVGVPVAVTVTDQVCDRTITGTHDSPVIVSSGLTCLAYGSEVIGTVTVASGASLHATGAAVDGPVFARGAASVELYGTAVAGPVSLRDGTTQVALIGNEITGRAILVGNDTGTTPIVVAANTFIGPLGCSQNQPPPVNNGQPNTVLGLATGQCADL